MRNNTIRNKNIDDKFGIVKHIVNNKNILIVDDSIVRGNTIKNIVRKLKKHNVKNIYIASCSPPIKYPNKYGIHIPSYNELLINNKTIKEIEEYLGIDKLIYQDLGDLCKSITDLNDEITDLELSVFTGEYLEDDED